MDINQAIFQATEIPFDKYKQSKRMEYVNCRKVFVYYSFQSGVTIPELAEMFKQTNQNIKRIIDNYKSELLSNRELRILENNFNYFINQNVNEQ